VLWRVRADQGELGRVRASYRVRACYGVSERDRASQGVSLDPCPQPVISTFPGTLLMLLISD
jgi:hypothetical protein